jgi:hypothetical protein
MNNQVKDLLHEHDGDTIFFCEILGDAEIEYNDIIWSGLMQAWRLDMGWVADAQITIAKVFAELAGAGMTVEPVSFRTVPDGDSEHLTIWLRVLRIPDCPGFYG